MSPIIIDEEQEDGTSNKVTVFGPEQAEVNEEVEINLEVCCGGGEGSCQKERISLGYNKLSVIGSSIPFWDFPFLNGVFQESRNNKDNFNIIIEDQVQLESGKCWSESATVKFSESGKYELGLFSDGLPVGGRELKVVGE